MSIESLLLERARHLLAGRHRRVADLDKELADAGYAAPQTTAAPAPETATAGPAQNTAVAPPHEVTQASTAPEPPAE